MKVRFVLAMLVAVPAFAQQGGLAGTMEVEHQRQQSRGELEGCSMVFRVAFNDNVYRKGQLVMVAGNFTFYVRDPTSAFLTLKAGLKDVGAAQDKAEAPAFAYLQSKKATTAKTKAVAADSDTPGFRMWVMPADTSVSQLLADVLEGEPVTLGMTRKGGSVDLLVPLDLTTASTTINPDGTASRQRSQESLQSFQECFVEVAAKLKR